MSTNSLSTEHERVAWIESNFSATDAKFLIAGGQSAGQIALDALNGNGPMPMQEGRTKPTTAPTTPAAYVDGLFGVHQRM